MGILTPGQAKFVSVLSHLTGLNPGVVTAWALAEESSGAAQSRQASNNNDWLNIGYTDTATLGAGNRVWSNPVTAAKATAMWIKGTWNDPGFGHSAPGIRAIVRTAGQSPQAQIAAIQNSGWASSHYPDLPGLYSQYGSSAPAPSAPGTGPQYGGPGPGSTTIPGMHIPGLGIGGTKQFDAQAYQKAQARFLLGNLQKQSSDLFNVPGSIQVSNPLISSGLLTPGKAPDPNNFMVYQKAQNALTKLAGQPLTVHPGAVPAHSGYVNPIAGFTIGRTDMGVDANAKPGTPIRALGNSQLVQVLPDWYAGQPLLLFKILNGPKAGQYWYVAEQINPASTHIGTVFHTGQPVGTYASSGTGIEIGWGSPSSSQRTLAGATTGYTEGQVTPAGTSFRNFIAGLH